MYDLTVTKSNAQQITTSYLLFVRFQSSVRTQNSEQVQGALSLYCCSNREGYSYLLS